MLAPDGVGRVRDVDDQRHDVAHHRRIVAAWGQCLRRREPRRGAGGCRREPARCGSADRDREGRVLVEPARGPPKAELVASIERSDWMVRRGCVSRDYGWAEKGGAWTRGAFAVMATPVAIDLATGGAFAFPPRVRSDLVSAGGRLKARELPEHVMADLRCRVASLRRGIRAWSEGRRKPPGSPRDVPIQGSNGPNPGKPGTGAGRDRDRGQIRSGLCRNVKVDAR